MPEEHASARRSGPGDGESKPPENESDGEAEESDEATASAWLYGCSISPPDWPDEEPDSCASTIPAAMKMHMAAAIVAKAMIFISTQILHYGILAVLYGVFYELQRKFNFFLFFSGRYSHIL